MLDRISNEEMGEHLCNSFKLWINQHPDGEYRYMSTTGCVFAEFLHEQGYPDATVGGFGFALQEGDKSEFYKYPSKEFGFALASTPFTFHALRDRINAL